MIKKYKILLSALLLTLTSVGFAQTQLISGGTGSAYTLTFPGAFSYTAGIGVTFKANVASGSGPVTININGLGAITIKKQANVDLNVGDIKADQIISLVFDGTNFQMINPEGNAISPSSIGAWGTTGNTGTVVGTNFIGTTDANNLAFKVNNISSGLIDQTNGKTFFGYNSGSGTVISVPNNSGFGSNALKNNSYATQNTAVGTDALLTQSFANGNVSYATDNTAIGYQALFLNQPTSSANGYQNTAIGSGALRSNTTATVGTAVGYQALYANTTGTANTAIGHTALQNNTTGIDNTAVGKGVLVQNITGNYNVGMGKNALNNNTASDNTAIGRFAMNNNTAGASNSVLGSGALAANTTGNNNVALGYQAGNTNTSGSGNTYIGFDADASLATLTNASALGANAYVTTSNSLVLGAINGTNGATANTNVGIGTTAPVQKLHVVIPSGSGQVLIEHPAAGNISYSLKSVNTDYSIMLNGTTLQFREGASPIMALWSNKLGIGTISPTSSLSVGATSQFQVNSTGDIVKINNVTTTFPIAQGAANTVLTNDGTGTLSWSVVSGTLNGGTTNYLPKWSSANSLSSTSLLYDNGTGVGIGTASPTNKLNLYAASGYNEMRVQSNGNYIDFGLHDINGSYVFSYGAIPLYFGTNGSERMRLTANGDVGIGTTGPARKLHVVDASNLGMVLEGVSTTGTIMDWVTLGNGTTSVNNTGIKGWQWLAYGDAYSTTSLQNDVILRSYNGTGATDVMHMDFGTGSIGIGAFNGGTHKMEVNGSVKATNITLTTGAANGFILTSDGTGNASWTANSADWKLTGNAGTTAGTNFIGTTDNVDLVFKRANTQAGLLASSNTALGSGAMTSVTSGTSNVAIGNGSQASLTTGSGNTSLGSGALGSNTSSNYNTAVGNSALSVTSGAANTAVGGLAMTATTTGNNNVAMGFWAMRYNTLGTYNTSIGTYSMQNNTVAGNNTAIGYSSLYTQSFSNGGVAWTTDNTAIGFEALYSNQPTSTGTGFRNTAIGSGAMRGNTTGSNNCATGLNSMYSNTTGSNNSSYGRTSLYANTTGQNNTAIGTNALNLNVAASNNTAVGSGAIYNNTYAEGNTAIGKDALLTQSFANASTIWTTGNTAVGYSALYFNQPTTNTNGYQNTAVGYFASASNTIGNYNSSLGYNAANAVNSGSGITAIGHSAGYAGTAVTTGTNSTFIGYQAQSTLSNITNSTALGYAAIANANNKIVIGNASVTVIGGFTNWTNLSDGRFKKNVNEDVIGLQFINSLRPVTYNLDIHSINELLYGENAENYNHEMKEVISNKEKIKYSGFIAQEVEEAANKTGYNFSGVIRPQHKNDHYSLSYSEFVVPLVKAVQELSKENEELKKKLDLQQKNFEAIQQQNASLKSDIEKIKEHLGVEANQK